jgi:dihydropyrimidinase
MEKNYDLLIKNGILASGSGMEIRDIAVRGEKISSIEETLSAEDAGEVMDAAGCYVLPGVIDAHTHPYYKDDFETLASTAAYGGVTTLIHYAYAFSGMEAVEAAEKAIEEGSRRSCLDFALHLGLFEVEKQHHQVPKIFSLGINSFKMFMTYAKLGRMTTDYYLAAMMDMIAGSGGIAMVHAENGLVTDYLEDKFNAQGLPSIEFFTKMRPDILEEEAINRAIAIAEVFGCTIYIPHVSAQRAMRPIVDARSRGLPVYAETCPQYLVLTEEDLFRWGPPAKIGPPLRSRSDIDALWKALADGDLDVVASDHAPKGQRPQEDFFSAAYGSSQVETLLTLTYDEGVNGGRITVPRMVELLSEQPAKIFGLYPQKGALLPGSDADILIFDPSQPSTITRENQHSAAGFSLYEGRNCLGRPVRTIQRGKTVLERGELKAEAGDGRFIARGLD